MFLLSLAGFFIGVFTFLYRKLIFKQSDYSLHVACIFNILPVINFFTIPITLTILISDILDTKYALSLDKESLQDFYKKRTSDSVEPGSVVGW